MDIEKEIIVMDNGSRVPVRSIIGERVYNPCIRLFRIPINAGKGGAVKLGLSKATGNIIIVQDADLEYLPKDIPALIAPIVNKQARVVYGSRILARDVKMHFLHRFANNTLTCIGNWLFNQHLTDMETGYKAFDHALLKRIQLESTEFEIETEITIKLARLGIQVPEIPISYNTRVNGISKVSVGDGLETLFLLLKERFFPDSRLVNWLFKCFKKHGKKAVNAFKRVFFSWIKRERGRSNKQSRAEFNMPVPRKNDQGTARG